MTTESVPNGEPPKASEEATTAMPTHLQAGSAKVMEGTGVAMDPMAGAAAHDGAEAASAPYLEQPASIPAVGNGVLEALAALWVTLCSIWQGKTVEAFRVGVSIKRFWMVGILAYSVVIGLLAATIVVRSVGGASDVFGDMTDMLFGFSNSYGVSVSDWIAVFFTGTLVGLVALILRTVCLKWTFAVRGSSQTFASAANIVVVSYVAPMALMLVAAILLMIPSSAIAGLVIAIFMILAVPLNLVSEILMYIGLNRTTQFGKSALIPHALFTALWLVLTVVAYSVLASIFLENIF